MTAAGVEVIADHELGLVKALISQLDDEDSDVIELTLPPETARELAFRLSFAAIKVEQNQTPS